MLAAAQPFPSHLAESEDCLPEGKGQPGTDFQDREVILHHLTQAGGLLIVGGVRFVYKRRG